MTVSQHAFTLCLLIPNLSTALAWSTTRTLLPLGRRKSFRARTSSSLLVPFDEPSTSKSHHISLHMSFPDEDDENQEPSSFHRSKSEEDEPIISKSTNKNMHSSSHNNVTTTTAAVEKRIRMARAQAEIDRILNGPDAPFDITSEMKRVASIAPPVTQTLAEEELEAKESQLEQDLYQAVKQQDYAKAAEVKREINQMHIDDCGAVLQVNSEFYRAFSHKDLKAMESIWLKDGTSTCIHPSCKPLVGSKAVLKSWDRMFEATNGSFQRSWMEPHEIRLTVKGAATAIVTCDEHVYARRFVRGQKRQTELINKLTATNIFRKVGGRWYMAYHHASWHHDSEASKLALRGAPQQMSGKSRSIMNNVRSSNQNDSIGMDGILGGSNLLGPLLGGSSSSDGNQGKEPVKRIIVGAGSLSDLLNGGLGDILKSGDSDESQSNIINFSPIEDQDNDEEDDDDDVNDDGEVELDVVAEEDEDEDYEDNDKEESSEAVTIIKQWGESLADKSSSSSSSKKGNGVSGAPKDALRQSCIAALRKLSDSGSISPKQKRVLLTDIITCSAKGEFSMVEVAYELLCGEGEDKDVAEEEFADQCRVFAESLHESTASDS